MNTQTELEAFLLHRPRVAALFSQMNETGIRWAIFAGSEVALLTGNRAPTDLDIWVHDDDFDTLANLVSHARREDAEVFPVTAADGEQLQNIASTLTFEIDGTDIDVMSRAIFRTSHGEFAVSFTDLAVENRMQFTAKSNAIWLANPFDTILIKAFMRRGAEQQKFDLSDAQALCRALEINSDYRQNRLNEVGSTSQVDRFLNEVGC